MADDTTDKKDPPPADDKGSDKPALSSKEPAASSPTDLADRLVQRYGSERAALSVLADENFQYRTRHREDTETITDLRPRSLTTEQKRDFDAYAALGKPSELKKKMESLPDLEAKVAEHNERDLYLKVGQATGMKPNVLQDLAKTKSFKVELRKEGDEEVAFALYGTNESKKLDEYVAEHLKDYIPSLALAEGEATDSGAAGKQVLPFPRQSSNTTPKGQGSKDKGVKEVAASYLGDQYKTPLQQATADK